MTDVIDGDVKVDERETAPEAKPVASDAEPPTEADTDTDTDTDTPSGDPTPRKWLAHALAPVIVVVLAALAGWIGFQVYQSHQDATQRELYLQVGRQGAINVTTIDFAEVDKDIQRILDSSTGSFHDDFASRSRPFIDVVKQAKSKSVGTVTAAGLESSTDSGAQVLVSVSVQTSNSAAAEQEPRDWRMRIAVQKVGDAVLVSKVEFVP